MALVGSIAGDILQAAVGSALKGAGGGEWLDMALSMAGNEGQISLIESIGSDFDDVYEAGVESEGDFSAVGDLSDHPEAIEEILAEVEAAMEDKFNAASAEANTSFSVIQELGLVDAIFF